MPIFDAEMTVVEAVSAETGLDPSAFSMKTKLRGGRDIRSKELEAIVASIERQLGKQIAPAVAKVNTVGELIELVQEIGP